MKTSITALALIAALPALAAEPAGVSTACTAITDAAQRLACFDRAAAAAPAPDTAAAVPMNPAAPAVTPAPAETPAKAKAEAETVQAHIAESRKATGGLYVLVLDNGQVWRHESGSMEPYLKAGEAVTIRKGALGSHRLTLDSSKSKNWIRVTRVR